MRGKRKREKRRDEKRKSRAQRINAPSLQWGPPPKTGDYLITTEWNRNSFKRKAFTLCALRVLCVLDSLSWKDCRFKNTKTVAKKNCQHIHYHRNGCHLQSQTKKSERGSGGNPKKRKQRRVYPQIKVIFNFWREINFLSDEQEH